MNGSWCIRLVFVALGLLLACAPSSAQCAGDCDGDRVVRVDEIVRAVADALAGESGSCAAADVDGDERISIDELIAAVLAALDGCPDDGVMRCNGHAVLCERGFDEVSYLTTHNAFSTAEDGFGGPNQSFSMTRQLRDGVRALMLDTYYFDVCRGGDKEGQLCPAGGCGEASECVTELHLCHGTCALGSRPLVDGLNEIRAFLEARPDEVVAIILESYISVVDTADAFADAGLARYAHLQNLGDPWPTLLEMIDADRRLVVFTDDADNQGIAWLHYVWDFAVETPFSFATPGDLRCDPNRGSPGNDLFIFNHFLTQVVGAPELAEQINFDPLLVDRVEECRDVFGQLPNFVTVDFYEIGDPARAVDRLNGVLPSG